MPSQSSVPAVKGALFSLLQTALPSTDVKWANTAADMARESAWMGNADFSGESVVALRTAPHAHTEVYTVPIVVMAVQDGDDPQATELRAWTLAADVEDALRADPTLGLSNVNWAKVQSKQPALYTRDTGWCMFVDLIVGVQARI